MSTDLSGLRNFKSKVNSLRGIDKKEIAHYVAEYGADIARDKYAGQPIDVSVVDNGKGSQIVASGSQVAYLEYGIGHLGAVSGYEGKLPSQTLHFESPKGHPQSTVGWQYNYDNPKTKTEKNGIVGWYYGGQFNIGRPAQAQMWKTAKEIKQKGLANIVREFLRKKGV